MKNEIISYTNKLPRYFEEEYNSSTDKLISHMKNKEYYLHNRKIVYRDTRICKDYSTKNLNQACFTNCIFDHCNLESVSFVNSRFIECRFMSCNLSSTNFRSSYFQDAYFDQPTIITGTKFGNSRFVNSKFDGCTLHSVTFDEAIFSNCTFSNSFWYAISLDLCMFDKSVFENVKFRNMNFEFSIFKDIHMNNMKLPFPTIPYIYGGFQYLKSTNDDIYITSQLKKETGISKEEYLSLLSDLEIYYAFSDNYFPLANIYLAKNDVDKCKSAIVLGIEKAVMTNDLRLIENFARLISFNSLFSMSERYDLLNYVVSKTPHNNSAIEIINQTNKCIFNFRSLLFNSVDNNSSLHLSIKTNIENNEQQVAFFINMIESVINSTNVTNNYSIELRHNSPYEFFINLFSDYKTICFILGLLTVAIKGSDQILSKVLTHISSIQNIKKQKLENIALEQQLELNNLDILTKKQELQQCKEKYQSMQNENISIDNVSYIIISNETNTIIQSSDIMY